MKINFLGPNKNIKCKTMPINNSLRKLREKSEESSSIGKITNPFKKYYKISRTLKIKTDLIKVKASRLDSFLVSWITTTEDNFITGIHFYQNKYITVLMKVTKKNNKNKYKKKKLIL